MNAGYSHPDSIELTERRERAAGRPTSKSVEPGFVTPCLGRPFAQSAHEDLGDAEASFGPPAFVWED